MLHSGGCARLEHGRGVVVSWWLERGHSEVHGGGWSCMLSGYG